MKRKLLAILLCVCLAFSLVACSTDEYDEDETHEITGDVNGGEANGNAGHETTPTDTVNMGDVSKAPQTAGNNSAVPDDDSWAIYWYLCGSDLETKWGCATTDLFEMLEVALPENVKVVIETGGSADWKNDFVDENSLCRFVYEGDTLSFVESVPSASMGEMQTLADFLQFADTNYPANHRVLLFWNHGGGSLEGAAFDELYGYDSVKLPELGGVLSALYGEVSSIDDPYFDLIGFDTCLMATVDVADIVKDYAKYLVASEETEPGNGWYYTGWMGDLAKNPSMSAAELGKSICDSYYEGCEMEGTESEITLSLTDLSKIPALVEELNTYGEECLVLASEDSSFFVDFYRSAIISENYGGNTKEQGFTDMVDLGHLARNTKELVPSSTEVLKALSEANIYRVNGPFRAESSGLSCYYSYDFDYDNLISYSEAGAGIAFKYLFDYELTGEMSDEAREYVSTLNIQDFAELNTLDATDWDGVNFTLNERGSAYIDLGEDAAAIISDIRLMLFSMSEEDDLMLYMGEDNNILCDWDNGIFMENFYGEWGCINDVPVYMEISYVDDSYTIYSVPVLLNGEEYNLQVAYTYDDGEYYILGGRQGVDESGMASKELRILEEGNQLDIIWKVTDFEAEQDFEDFVVESIIVDEDLSFTYSDIGDGEYGMVFVMRDSFGNEAMTEALIFNVIDGEIFTSIVE